PPPPDSSLFPYTTLFRSGAGDDLLDARPQTHRADAQPVGGQRVGGDEVLEPQLGRIDPQLLGDLVEVDLEREARLRGAVPAFRTDRKSTRLNSSHGSISY